MEKNDDIADHLYVLDLLLVFDLYKLEAISRLRTYNRPFHIVISLSLAALLPGEILRYFTHMGQIVVWHYLAVI